MPGDGRGRARRACEGQARNRLRTYDEGRQRQPRRGLLSWQLRVLAGDHGQWRTGWARDARALRRCGRPSQRRPPMGRMSATVYVPRDSSALSMGAGAVADAIGAEAKRRNTDVRDIRIVRNGSRGLYWLEPLVEVEAPKGRVAYGPVSAGDVASLFDANFLAGENHRLALGVTEEIPYLKN